MQRNPVSLGFGLVGCSILSSIPSPDSTHLIGLHPHATLRKKPWLKPNAGTIHQLLLRNVLWLASSECQQLAYHRPYMAGSCPPALTWVSHQRAPSRKPDEEQRAKGSCGERKSLSIKQSATQSRNYRSHGWSAPAVLHLHHGVMQTHSQLSRQYPAVSAGPMATSGLWRTHLRRQ